MDFALFERLTRRLELTPQGPGAGAAQVQQSISEIDRSVFEVIRFDDAAPLKVTMLPSVASHWLIPRLPRIRSRHPGLEVEVIADSRLFDLRTEGIDIAIRFCRTPHPSYAATRLMGDRVFPVCAPDLLKQCGPVDGIDALLALPLLHDSATESNWRAWLDHFGRSDVACHAGQSFSEAGMMIEAATVGLGVALARASLVAEHIASGALVCPLRLAAPTALTYYLLGLPEAVNRPRRSPRSANCWSGKLPQPRHSRARSEHCSRSRLPKSMSSRLLRHERGALIGGEPSSQKVVLAHIVQACAFDRHPFGQLMGSAHRQDAE